MAGVGGVFLDCHVVLKCMCACVRAMSVSNYLCGERRPVAYVQCWFPVQYPGISSGILPTFKGIVNHGKAALYGGSALEHRLYDDMMKELKDDAVNMPKYAKNGVAESHLDVLKSKIQAYEDEYDRGHPSARTRPQPAQVAPTAPLYPMPPPTVPGVTAHTACQWMLVPCYPPLAPLSSSRWSCHAP